MSRILHLDTPKDFDFSRTVTSHGWSALSPFVFDRENKTLGTVLNAVKPIAVEISSAENRLQIELFDEEISDRIDKTISRDVRHILRLDDDLREFHKLTKAEKKLAWMGKQKIGRLLRSPTVFEDLVKTICTTNCSWALTKIMVANLVEKLGAPAADGRKAFPTVEAIARQSEDFYRAEIRAGYRAPYFSELAQKILDGKLDVESWLHTDLPTRELKREMKKVKGVGDYAAENLLKLVGRYDGLALDSMLRGRFYAKHNAGSVCEDNIIRAHYTHFGEWSGLAIWFDMTDK